MADLDDVPSEDLGLQDAPPVRSKRAATFTCYPDGPLLVRGDVELKDADGRSIPRRRKTVALCRCGKSGLAPLCDGTHKQIGFRAPGDLQ